MKPRIYLSSPHMGGTEQRYVQEAFDTNWVAPLGPNLTAFEAALESYLGQDRFVAALSTGTAALHLALRMIEVGPGDEVICQSMTFAASANPIVYLGATPVFIDSEPSTWNLCPDHLEVAIKDRLARGKRIKAIVAVHLYGMPYRVKEIHRIAAHYNIPVIEDSAEALGSRYDGIPCGTFGDLSVLSFNGNKIITTSGGGALVTRTRELKDRAVFLATQARDAAPYYQHSEIGYNYRLSNISAGIGRGQMEVLNDHVDLRRQMQDFYASIFDKIPGISVFKEPAASYFSNHWLTCIQIDPEHSPTTPDQLREGLESENIESRPLWKPMHLQPVFRDTPFYGSSVSERIFLRGLCLPSGSNLSEADRHRIKTAIDHLL